MTINGHADRNTAIRAVEGDTEALSELLCHYGPAARRMVREQIPPEFRSVLSDDDVMQESYAEAFLAIGGFDPEGSFGAWLARIARNNLLDAIRALRTTRRQGRHRRVNGLDDGENLLAMVDVLADTGTTPSQHASRRELAATLSQALQRLPDAYRQVVQLYDLEGHPVQQVSETLGCSIGAVFMRRMRAHRMLRDLLDTVRLEHL